MRGLKLLAVGAVVAGVAAVAPAAGAATDTTRPTRPTRFHVVTATAVAVKVRWHRSWDVHGSGVRGYELFRNGHLVAKVRPKFRTRFVYRGLRPSTRYRLGIQAFDRAGNLSHLARVHVTTKAAGARRAPCNRAFVTSDTNGGWSTDGYYVHNNMWNVAGYPRTKETLSACSYKRWWVTATADNSKRDGAVKTYPNVHKDIDRPLRSFSTIKSTFAATSPHVGIYNVAYDIWLNGLNREIMLWTENFHQYPAGSLIARGLVFGGITWDVYARSGNGYIAFVARQPVLSGSLNIKAILDYLVSHGRESAGATLSQICYGVEIVSTNAAPATFDFTDFSVTLA